MRVQVINTSKHPLPEYHSDHAAGLDLRANIYEPITLGPLDQAMVPTGVHLALPVGYEGQVRPRSGLAAKHGITLTNAPGTIDADYRGEISVIVINLSNTPYTINDGERIAQLVIAKHERIEWEPVAALAESTRANGGFGHTGTK